MNKLFLLILGLLVTFGCGKETSVSELESATNAQYVSALKESSDIKLFKILPKNQQIDPEKRGYNVEPKEKTLSEDQVARLKKLLLNDESYIFTSRKEAPFFAEVLYKIDDNYTVLVSFSAKQIKIKGPDTKAMLDIDPMSDELEHLSAQILKN